MEGAEGGYAEVGPGGEIIDTHGLGGVVADPLDGRLIQASLLPGAS
jgi:hypothetical protein